jgi:hypothetical protein
MSYSDLLSTISLIATIVGLVFVIVSLRQTRRSINASTYQHILNREAANWDQVRTGDIAVRIQALKNFGVNVSKETYSSKEDILLDHIAVFNFYEGIYFQKIQGVLNKEVWENWERSLKQTMQNNEFKESWGRVGYVYSPGFLEYVKNLIGEE